MLGVITNRSPGEEVHDQFMHVGHTPGPNGPCPRGAASQARRKPICFARVLQDGSEGLIRLGMCRRVITCIDLN